jgi:S1-C subfamily serine protease
MYVQEELKSLNPARLYETAVADAVEKVIPSVVVVRTEAVEFEVRRDFFGFYYRVPRTMAGQGSGVVIDKEGHVLTSYHVVKDARHIEVVLNDETKLAAKLVGSDSVTDLAVLKIINSELDLPAVAFGDSDQVRVGHLAIAIGSPFSLEGSVTVGHVSQKGRRVELLPYEDFIQTDAAINPGNSGGPLVDVEGYVIGINAAIQAPETAKGGGVGIAFSIPANLAMVVAQSIIDNGIHEWPWVGAQFGEIEPQMRKKFFDGAGVPVEEVWRDTPAAKVGLLPGDIVLEVDGVPVSTEYDIYRIIFNHVPGDDIAFRVQREQEQLDFLMQLQAIPEQMRGH